MKKFLLLSITAMALCLAVNLPAFAGLVSVTQEEINSTPDKYPEIKGEIDPKYFGSFADKRRGYWLGIKDGKIALFFVYLKKGKVNRYGWCDEKWVVSEKGFTNGSVRMRFDKEGKESYFSFKMKYPGIVKRID